VFAGRPGGKVAGRQRTAPPPPDPSAAAAPALCASQSKINDTKDLMKKKANEIERQRVESRKGGCAGLRPLLVPAAASLQPAADGDRQHDGAGSRRVHATRA